MTPDWPAPEVGARDAQPHEIPTGAARLRKLAEAGGWTVRPTYARGTAPDPRIRKETRPGKVVDNLALRMHHEDGRRAVAVWIDGKFNTAYFTSTAGIFPVQCNATQLRERLSCLCPGGAS